MKVSIIIPVYNEERTIEEIIKLVWATDIQKEVIIVDDGSTDNTHNILKALQDDNNDTLIILSHKKNWGKGMAIRTGLTRVTGDLVLIQDADLEYNPSDYTVLLAPFDNPAVNVVYGSRNLRRNPRSSYTFYWGGRLLSHITNILYGSSLTDITTGYKVFHADSLEGIDLKGDGFEFCAEVTGKFLRRELHIQEVPISYNPRSWDEGKKIRWRDGLLSLWRLIICRFGNKKQNLSEKFIQSRADFYH